MRFRPPRAAAACLVLACLTIAAGCGGDGDGERDSGRTAPAVASREDFPQPRGRTIAELRESLGPGPVLAPSVSLLEPGENRFGFGLFDRSRKQIAEAPAAIYVARRGEPARGPYAARYESLTVDPEFRSESVTADPDAAESLYVADLELERPGDYEVLAAVRLDDRVVAADPISVPVVRDAKVPEAGERPPRIETPTVEDVGGNVEEIDTRVPPAPDLHEEDFADVVGEKPAVLLFATPALCVSRVCGPVVDIQKQVKERLDPEGELAWIHMEIYNDNEVDKGFRRQVLDWSLPTEPWAFTIDRSGRVAARLEGAFSARELERAVEAARR